MATTEAHIPRTSLLDHIRVLICFIVGGFLAGLLLAWITTRPGLQSFLYFIQEKFLYPRYTYFIVLGISLFVGLSIPFAVARSCQWFIGKLGNKTHLILSGVLIVSSSLAPNLLTNLVLNLGYEAAWGLAIVPLLSLTMISAAMCITTGSLRLLPIMCIWNGVFLSAGLVMVFVVVEEVPKSHEWYDFIQWPILGAVLALSFGAWIIWRERIASQTAKQIVGQEQKA